MKRKVFNPALLAIIVTVAIVMTSVLFAFLPRRYVAIDMTADKMYGVSEPTKLFLSRLDEDVTIYVLNADNSEKEFEEYISHQTVI